MLDDKFVIHKQKEIISIFLEAMINLRNGNLMDFDYCVERAAFLMGEIDIEIPSNAV